MKRSVQFVVFLCAIFGFAGAAQAAYDYQFEGQTPYSTVNEGEEKENWIQLKNTGDTEWCRDCTTPVRLGTSNPQDRGSGFQGSDWLSNNRIPMDQERVAPGQSARFTFNVKPKEDLYLSGTYREYFRPVVDSLGWMKDIGIYWEWTVPAPTVMPVFTWYGSNGDHWTAGPNTTVVDTPRFGNVTGPYDSGDPDVIRQQATLIRDMGVKAVLLDAWVEPSHPNHYSFQNSLKWAEILRDEFPEIKYAFLVEPSINSQELSEAIPQSFMDYVYANHANSPSYFKFKGKPFISTFYDRVCNADSRFNCVGFSNGRAQFPDYWSIPVTNKYRVTSIIPRYDDRALCPFGSDRVCQAHDPTYAHDLMGHQFNGAMGFRATTDLLMLNAWNEYHERTNLEPHINPDSFVAPDYSYQRFKDFLNNRWKK